MRIDWVPFSATSLVAGATALSVSALLRPTGESSRQALRLVEEQDGRWLAVALLYFVASVTLTAGLPCVLTLFESKGYRTCLLALGVFTIGAVGIAGYAMLLAFFRALVIEDEIASSAFDHALDEPGLAVFLYGWVLAFYLGELLLAVALFRAGTVPRWVPGLLVAHVALLPVTAALPPVFRSLSVVLITVALAGVGIAANSRHALRP